ncbi:MAG: SgcJ/EcaC family oxidoreductase [Opitutae bacterium]
MIKKCLPPALALWLILAGTAACVNVNTTKERQPQDEQAIRSSIEKMNVALAQRDLAGFMALFDDSDNIMLIGSDVGEIYRGRQEVAGFIKMLYGMPFVFSFELTQVVITPDKNSAWAFVDGAMVHTGASGKVKKIPYRFAITLVKREGGWRWQLFHGSIPRGE